MLITGVWICGGGWAIPHSSQWHWPLPQQGGVEPRLKIVNIFFDPSDQDSADRCLSQFEVYQHLC